MRNALLYAVIGLVTGLIAPVGLFAVSVFDQRNFDPLRVFAAMAAGGVVLFAAMGWIIGRKDDALRARNLELAQLSGQLQALSATDPLTGIPNRRAFDDRLGIEMARAARYDTPISLVMVDVDHFKNLNDLFGHQIGDQVLKGIAMILDGERRAGDLVARYGGEEFAAILPHTDAEAATAWAERARQRIATTRFPGVAERQVTASFGVTSFDASSETPDSLIEAADTALYQAKHRGRNRVERLVPARLAPARLLMVVA